ncbi:MAG: class I SAM-dependent methyltransferase [Planctomycetota bacterium]
MKEYGSPEVAANYRRKHSGSWLRRLAHGREQKLLNRLLQRVSPIDSVLDCPCGTGRFLPLLETHARRVYAGDVAHSMVALARDDGRALCLVGDVNALPLPDDAVDVVVCMRLLHHLADPADRVRALTGMRRVARRAVIVSFADAETRRGRRASSRRQAISEAQLRADAAAAGLALEPPILRVGGLFSRFAFAFLRLGKD